MNNFVHKFLDSTVGNVFGKDITCREPVDPCDAYQPGPLVEIGKTGINLFKKFLMPGGLCAAVPVAKSVPISPEKPVECNNDLTEKKLIRPSELPLYVHEPTSSKDVTRDIESPPSALEEGFRTIRKSIQGVVNEYLHVTDTVKDKLNTSMEHSAFLLDFLREESNMLPRAGAIAIGGLTGFVFGLRGGKFKRLVYTTTGVLTVAGVCYPKHAAESITASKHYINIGYNFVCGDRSSLKSSEMESSFEQDNKCHSMQTHEELLEISHAKKVDTSRWGWCWWR